MPKTCAQRVALVAQHAHATIPATLLPAILAALVPTTDVFAHVAEIQVYDGEIAPPGTFNLTLHSNYTPPGASAQNHPSGFAKSNALTLGPELAYGVNDWFELGMLFPVATEASGHWQFDGAEFRGLFVVPHAAERSFFYGANFAFVINRPRWSTDGNSFELRPIIGWHLGDFDLIFNPILESGFEGFNETRFEPVARLALRLSTEWTVAVEHYGDAGAIGRLASGRERSKQLFAVVDYSGQSINLEGGVGFGMTSASDDLVLKLIISRDLD